MTVNIIFPASVEPHLFEHEMEEAIRQNSDFRIKVRFIDSIGAENNYIIRAEHPEAVFLAGVAAGKLMCKLRKV